MDLQICGALSLAEMVGMVGVNNLATYSTAALVYRFFRILIAQYFLVKVYRFFIYPTYLSPLRHIPGPKDNAFFMGQTLNQFKASCPTDLYVKWSRQWPKAPFIRYLEFGNKETLLINSLTAHKEVLQTYCYSMIKPPFVARLICEVTGNGVFTAEGDEHRKQRRLLAGSFSLANLKKIMPIFKEKAKTLTEYVDEQLGKSETSTVEMQSVFSRATLDVIGTTVLGVELDNLRSSTSSLGFNELYDRMLNQPPMSQLLSFINVIVPIRWLPIEANMGFVRASNGVQELLRGVIRERIKTISTAEKTDTKIDSGKYVSRDILTYMIEERYTGEDAWSEDDILGNTMNFMAGGFETSATGLTWASFVLATMPDVQDKLRSEISSLLQKTPDPGYSDIDHLPYLHNFLRELLRLYSPAIQAHRMTNADLVLDGVPVPKGTPIFLCPAVMNTSTEIWGETAALFRPERWDELKGDAVSPYAVETFINGPRVCIGRQFALSEMKIMLIAMISSFRFSPSPEQDLNKLEYMNPSLTLRPKDGMRVKLVKLE